MKAIIYARISTQKQNEKSIEEQIRVCEEYAKEKGYTIIEKYIDIDSREQFEQMVKVSSKKKFQEVIVYQLDRFARNRFDSAIYRVKLKKNGVKVLSARENISDDTSEILMESILEGMAEYYSAEHSRKIKEGIARKKKEREKIANEG